MTTFSPHIPEVDGRYDRDNDKFILPDGGVLGNLHRVSKDCELGCVIHNPSNHSMRSFPVHWRSDRGIMERICPHGIGHPDIDSMRYLSRIGQDWQGVHGCDGCCRP